MFLFKSPCSLCVVGKHVLIMSRNFFPMFFCGVVAAWWVVPCDVSFSLAFVVCGVGACVFVCWVVFQLVAVSAFLKCVLVWFCCLVEYVFLMRSLIIFG